MPFARLTVGRARFRREPGISKFARLKRLKISVRNSRFALSVNLIRLLKMISNCWKFGPRNAFRGTLPKVPGCGVVNAAGFKIKRSLLRYGFTPGTKSGLRTLREAPPPGVLTTAMNPGGNGLAALIVPGNCPTNPLAKVVVTPPAPVGTVQPLVARH